MSQLEQAANDAVFYFQMSTPQAVRYVEQQVPGVERGAVIAALVDVMVFHKRQK